MISPSAACLLRSEANVALSAATAANDAALPSPTGKGGATRGRRKPGGREPAVQPSSASSSAARAHNELLRAKTAPSGGPPPLPR
eukprot:CAMPEP_0185397400 /NCGR_PEP_ID=MMETSP1364-20130426/86707_1 /TAXON_ID=38817 /ORGANISM="Gephyrocapsa oceanica, Strain RCC1303" /LENGTH=84 /DNA_ID=CAMNT_0027999627 /DNA_START=16 /DNA_END=267 /DNA_ORIENTATION=+